MSALLTKCMLCRYGNVATTGTEMAKDALVLEETFNTLENREILI